MKEMNLPCRNELIQDIQADSLVACILGVYGMYQNAIPMALSTYCIHIVHQSIPDSHFPD